MLRERGDNDRKEIAWHEGKRPSDKCYRKSVDEIGNQDIQLSVRHLWDMPRHRAMPDFEGKAENLSSH